MAHPTRTGDLVVFAYPPYQFDAATPGTLVARSAFFGQHGYVPDVQDLAPTSTCVPPSSPAAGCSTRTRPSSACARSTWRRPSRTCWAFPSRSTRKVSYGLTSCAAAAGTGTARRSTRHGGGSRTLVPIIGLTDFHGQLEPDHVHDRRQATCPSAARRSWRPCSTKKRRNFPGQSLLLASGDNVGASPANSGLLEDMPAIDVENAWGLDATSYGNHEFDYGIERLLQHQARANFPFLGANIVDEDDAAESRLGAGHARLRLRRSRIGVIGIELKETPELVSAGATAGLKFLDEAETIQDRIGEAAPAGHQGADRADPPGHGRRLTTPSTAMPASRGTGPIMTIVKAIQDTTVDVVLAGHTHRVSNLMVGHILVAEGMNAGASYSVVQMIVQGRTSSGPARPRASPRTSALPSAPTSRPSSTMPTPRRPCCATR